jgi:hypothetical protein
MEDSVVLASIGNKEYEKRNRRIMLLSDRTLRSCPRCESLCTVKKDDTDICCANCLEIYCAAHGAAHPDEMCDEFMKRVGHDASFDEIARISKPCPHCTQPIELQAGCNHVVCPSCRTDFCFKCGCAELRGTLVRQCPNCEVGYVVHRYLPVWFIIWLVMLPCWAVYFVFLLCSLGLGFAVVATVRCKWGTRTAVDVFLCIFLPFIAILDLLFQTFHWHCKCGPCTLPMESADENV